MQANAWLWRAVGALVALAVLAGVADWRRKRRDDWDHVGMIYWPTVQVLALIGAAVIGFIALHP